ncbi:PqqD family protein [uncultured Draconibacterium sp.]|uniref:PqqD family protein n=1 Tax=uncultured Draconibacterium sp. TaxID=1573823 RepID=UPI003216461F
MAKIDAFEKIYKKDENIISRNIAGKTVLIPIQKTKENHQDIYHLNEVSSFIWELINNENSVWDLLKRVENEFSIDNKTAKIDLVDFLNDLESLKFIK